MSPQEILEMQRPVRRRETLEFIASTGSAGLAGSDELPQLDPEALEAAMAAADAHYNEMETAAPWRMRRQVPKTRAKSRPRRRKGKGKGKGKKDDEED
eukprot:1958319-Karenia_brevis.AAC.1